jgi:hypothetical protein
VIIGTLGKSGMIDSLLPTIDQWTRDEVLEICQYEHEEEENDQNSKFHMD